MFKHTGIVRRIDDAGRVGIPKEIRRRLRIQEGDPIEIGEGDNSVMLRKYSVLELFDESIRKLLEIFSKITGMPIVLCNTSHVLCSVRTAMKSSGLYISTELADSIRDNKVTCSGMEITVGSGIRVAAIERIIVNGSIEGALIIPFGINEITDTHIDCLRLCAEAIAIISE